MLGLRSFPIRLFIVLNLLGRVSVYAQTEEEVKDTIIPKEWKITTSVQLGDTLWWALQQKTNTEVMSLLPTLSVLKATFDSLEIKQNPQIIRIKYNYIYYNVGKQLKVLNAKAKANKLKFKTCEILAVNVKEGKDDKGRAFGYVTVKCRKNKREFSIKFVTLQLNGHWYLMDELKLEFPEDDPYYKKVKESPVKIKKKN